MGAGKTADAAGVALACHEAAGRDLLPSGARGGCSRLAASAPRAGLC